MKPRNEYATVLGTHYDAIPKEVLAAIAVAFAIQLKGDGNESGVTRMILSEWRILHENRIVRQRPPKGGIV